MGEFDRPSDLQYANDRPQKPAGGTEQKAINLALQGGGAHAAFGWGVLDRLLEDERINVEGISATSAGAMNAACLAYGMAIGGRQAARHVLAAFWERVADVAAWSPLQPSWHDRLRATGDRMVACVSRLRYGQSAFQPLRVQSAQSESAA